MEFPFTKIYIKVILFFFIYFNRWVTLYTNVIIKGLESYNKTY